MTNDEIKKILQDAIEYRQRDIAERQIEIDNHEISLKIVNEQYKDDPEIETYKQYLTELLRTGKIEQTKMKIFLEAAKINLAKISD
jgi:hypothetical protein